MGYSQEESIHSRQQCLSAPVVDCSLCWNERFSFSLKNENWGHGMFLYWVLMVFWVSKCTCFLIFCQRMVVGHLNILPIFFLFQWGAVVVLPSGWIQWFWAGFQPNRYNFQQWMSWVLRWWRTWWNAITLVICSPSWIIIFLNAYCAFWLLQRAFLSECDLTLLSYQSRF